MRIYTTADFKEGQNPTAYMLYSTHYITRIYTYDILIGQIFKSLTAKMLAVVESILPFLKIYYLEGGFKGGNPLYESGAMKNTDILLLAVAAGAVYLYFNRDKVKESINKAATDTMFSGAVGGAVSTFRGATNSAENIFRTAASNVKKVSENAATYFKREADVLKSNVESVISPKKTNTTNITKAATNSTKTTIRDTKIINETQKALSAAAATTQSPTISKVAAQIADINKKTQEALNLQKQYAEAQKKQTESDIKKLDDINKQRGALLYVVDKSGKIAVNPNLTEKGKETATKMAQSLGIQIGKQTTAVMDAAKAAAAYGKELASKLGWKYG